MIKLRDDFFVKEEAYLYWIKSSAMNDISSQGYVGVTRRLTDRLKQHDYNLRKSKVYYHRGFIAKYKESDLEMLIVNCGSEEEMYQSEQLLRPEKNIGWNYAVGGRENGISNKNFKIAGVGLSYARASAIFGKSHYAVTRSISSCNKSPNEALGVTTTVDNLTWCNYPTDTGYIKFLIPISKVEFLKHVVLEEFESCKNLTTIGKKYGVSDRVVRKILSEIHGINFASSKSCCYNGVWFSFYTILSSDELYNILDFYFRVLSDKVVGMVYSIPYHRVRKILQSYYKHGGVNPYNTDKVKDNIPFRLIFNLVKSGLSYVEIAERLKVSVDFVRFRYYASVTMFCDEYGVDYE